MQNVEYRHLTATEISALKSNGCHADDWKNIQVREGFDPARIFQTVFSGQIRIGALSGKVSTHDGIDRCPIISRASLRNVTIGNNCSISNIGGWLSNLDVGDDVLIENVGTIACAGETAFGNGHEIAVLNEGGGRELKITRRTSAQIAYLTVLYRDRKDLVARLNEMVEKFSSAMKSRRAAVGSGSRIANTTEILDVWIGPSSTIEGVLSLKNGTIDASPDAPVLVKDGVIAENFIFQRASSVTSGAMVSSSLVGEGARIGKQFSAENSVFFANSEGFHSEACSIFAGPYTVTHHRSTLLIAALFSFYNAGSGTNQSNHMYKLGPLHQGILERGCKTGSFSYLLWPSRIGAFTAVIGKHYANFDTSDLPFSYIAEDDGKSTIVPAMNFFTVGTMRDGEKWPARDRRKFNDKLDLIIFDVLSPFTGQKMIKAREILNGLADSSEKSQTYVTYNGIHIKRLLLKTCCRYYRLALDKYFGDALLRRVEETSPSNIRDILHEDPKGQAGDQPWIDLGGLLCCKSRVEQLIAQVVSRRIESLDALQEGLRVIYNSYRSDEWNWLLHAYKKSTGCELAVESPDNLRAFVSNWRDSSLKLLNMVMGDAQKEFEGSVRLGFGIDGNPDDDFAAVRGHFDDNTFVKTLKKNMDAVQQKFEKLNQLIK